MSDSVHHTGRRYLLYASEVYALPVLRPLQDAIRGRGAEAAWFFDGPGAEYLRQDERRLGTVAEVRQFDPVAVFVPGNWVASFFPGVKVQVFHGFSVGKRSEEKGHFRIRGFFDLYCTQGSTTTPHFEALAARHGYFAVRETGWPKMDPLFREPNGSNPWTEGWGRDRPVVLYASTFTQSLSSAPKLAETIRRLSRSGKWNWLATLHPKTPAGVVETYKGLQGPHLRFAETEDTLSLLRAADVIVSDTSSIILEFLLQHKPAVTFRNNRPGPQLIDIRDPAEMESAIETALRRPEALMRAIVAFAHAIHPYRDGRSSERVLGATEDFIRTDLGRLKPKPPNLWRKLQVCRRIGHYSLR